MKLRISCTRSTYSWSTYWNHCQYHLDSCSRVSWFTWFQLTLLPHLSQLVGLQEEGLQVHTEQSTAPEVPPGNSGAAGSGVLPGLPGPSAGAASEWPEGYVYPPGGPTSTQSDLKRKALDDLDEYDLDDFLVGLLRRPDASTVHTNQAPAMTCLHGTQASRRTDSRSLQMQSIARLCI